MKTTFPLLFVVTLALSAVTAAQAQLSQSRLDAIEEAAYQKELARLQAQRAAQAADPLASPERPGRDASQHEWNNYNNAVAAWNQRTAAAQQQALANAARARQRDAIILQAEVTRRMAAKEEQKRQESEAAYQLWLQQRAVYAIEVQAQAMADLAAKK